MERIYQDKELGYTMGRFPKPTVKISKKYNCTTVLPRPEPDSTMLDPMLELLNIGDIL